MEIREDEEEPELTRVDSLTDRRLQNLAILIRLSFPDACRPMVPAGIPSIRSINFAPRERVGNEYPLSRGLARPSPGSDADESAEEGHRSQAEQGTDDCIAATGAKRAR